MKKNFKAFSLIEIIVAVLIISMILMTSMDLFVRATSLKTKLMEQTNLEKNVFYFSEKLFTLIKNG